MWGGNALTQKWGETGNIALNDGLHQNNHIAVFPDKVHGAAAQFDLWHTSKNYHNQQLAHAIRIWSGGNSWPEYVALIAKLASGLTATTVIDDALLAGPLGLALVKAQAQMEAGRPYPLTDQQWAQAQDMVFPKPVAPAPEVA
jgi:outer membrane PBP1 activator LpoA protein